MIRIAVVAPAFALRVGLRAILSAAPAPAKADPALEVVLDAGSLEEFERYALQTDVLLLVSPPSLGEPLRRIVLQAEGRLALLLLTDDSQAGRKLVRLPLRAWGVLPVDASPEELMAALGALDEGLLVGSPALFRPVVESFLAGQVEEEIGIIESLTDREIQVLQLLAWGLANKQIALRLGISENTVKFHVSSIYTKLGATNRTEAVRMGVQQGLVLL